MKKAMILIVVMVMIFTGCTTSDLEDYKKAAALTGSYDSGVTDMSIKMRMTFDETGLTAEEIRDLSYFEQIEFVSEFTYLADGDLNAAKAKTYLNFGGLGFDMVYFTTPDRILIQLPIMDKYMELATAELQSQEAEAMDTEQFAMIQRIVKIWTDVLNEEDVFSGSKDYVMTDKGQIKTTTYTLTIDSEQFEGMKAAIIEIIEEEDLVAAFMENSSPYGQVEGNAEMIEAEMKEFLENLRLESLDSMAYVDFDGRIVRETMNADLIHEASAPGLVETIHLEFEINHDQLGQVDTIEIPVVSEEDLIRMNDGDSFETYFPEGLFR